MKLVELSDTPESTGRSLVPLEDDPVYEAARMAAEGMSDTEKLLARTGRVMGGTYRGIKQIIGGDTPDMAEDRTRERALADAQGNLGGAGGIVLGALADPVTAPLFAIKAPASLLGWGLQGAGFGAAQGALAEVSPGDSRAEHAAIGAAGGAVLMPAVGKGLNMAGRGAATGANRLLGTDFAVPPKIPLMPAARVSRDVADTVGRKLVPIEDAVPAVATERKLVPIEDVPLDAKAISEEYAAVIGGAKVLPEPAAAAPLTSADIPPMPEFKAESLLQAIKKLGGIDKKEIRDLTGEARAGKGRKGLPVGMFKNDGRTLDDLASELRANGWEIADDQVDGGVQHLRDRIQAELAGEKQFSIADNDRLAAWEWENKMREEQFAQLSEQERAAVIDFADDVPAKSPEEWGKLTEDQKNAELDQLFGPAPKPVAGSPQGGEGIVPRQNGLEGKAPEEAGAQEAGFALEGETEAQIRTREALIAKANEEAQLAANAPSPDGFNLTGSDRARDVGAAAGQRELDEFGPGTLGMNVAPSAVKKMAQETMQAFTKYAGKPLHELVKANPGTSASGVSGMVGGWNSADDDATTVEKTTRAAAGFVLGALAGRGAGAIPVGGKNVGEWLSRGIINNYGRSADVVAAEQAMRMFKSQAGSEWVDLVKDVAKMDAGQRRALYQMMQGEAPQQADLMALNDKARGTITRFGQMMVDAGMLDAGTFGKNQATYLHREYTSKLEGAATSGVSDKIAKFAASELRPRGIMFDVPEAQAQKYIDAGAELWDTRKDGIVTLRRQLTKPEREALGEIEDAGYAIARTGQLMTHDLATYKFYADLANNPKAAQDINPGGWIQVNEGKVKGTKLNKFGNLEGKFVPQEVYDDLTQLRTVQSIADHPAVRWYMNVNSAWKAGKTALNPTVHVNNIVSNTILYDLSDASWSALGQAGKQMLKGGKEYDQAKALGVFSVNFAQQELRGAARSAMEEFSGIKSSGSLDAALNYARKTWDATGGKMMRAYQGEDNVFRLGVFIDRIKKGETPEVAAADAKRWMIDYDINAPVIQAARNTALPFVSYTYRVVPLLTEVALEKPWKFAKWAALGFALNAASEKRGGGDTAKERALMSQRDKGNVFGMPFLPPQMLKLPKQIGDTPQYLDITRWVPGGDVMDASAENKMVPFLPQPLQPGGMVVSAVQAGLGFDQFTNKRLVGLGLSDAEDAKIKGAYLAQQFLPNNPLMPGSFAQGKIIRSAVGEPSILGDNLPVWQAVLQTVGIKIRPADLNKMQMRATFETKQDIETIKEQIVQAMHEKQAGKLSEEQLRKFMENRMIEATKRAQSLQKKLTAGE